LCGKGRRCFDEKNAQSGRAKGTLQLKRKAEKGMILRLDIDEKMIYNIRCENVAHRARKHRRQ
jgi:hypothetical protein